MFGHPSEENHNIVVIILAISFFVATALLLFVLISAYLKKRSEKMKCLQTLFPKGLWLYLLLALLFKIFLKKGKTGRAFSNITNYKYVYYRNDKN